MRTLLLSIAVLTLTVVPSASASKGMPLQVIYPNPPTLSFGAVTYSAGVAKVTLTANNATAVTIGATSVALDLAGWTAEPVVGLANDGRTVPIPNLGPGASVAVQLKLSAPDNLKPAARIKVKLVASALGAVPATTDFDVPGVELVARAFGKVEQVGFNGLLYKADVFVAGRADSKNCNTKRLKPSAGVFVQTKPKREGGKPGKLTKVASGSLAKGTLSVTGNSCRLAFEYFFDHKHDGKLGSFTFTFKPTIGGGFAVPAIQAVGPLKANSSKPRANVKIG